MESINMPVSDEMKNETEEFQGEVIEENAVNEDVFDKYDTKSHRFREVMTTQCIICIIIAIIIAILNLTKPDVVRNIQDEYNNLSASSEKVNDALVSLVSSISDFLNSSPNDRI